MRGRQAIVPEAHCSSPLYADLTYNEMLKRSMAVSSEFESRGSEEHSLVRMNFRTKPRIKATIQRAAALAGLDDSAFTMQAAYQAARAVISSHEITELKEIDHAAFFAALDQPAPATPALKAAFQRHQRTVVSR
jgi:uncharacterized protein (DUF1778 family)